MQTPLKVNSSSIPDVTTKRGATLVEYVMLVALIAAICVVGVRQIGLKSSSNFNKITSRPALIASCCVWV